jgi:AcrR family transcriptional regulator
MFIYRISDYTLNMSTTRKRAGKQVKRVYESPARERQAGETRSRIVEAARKLLVKNGYAGMTVPAVARAAGVAVPTVYAIFGSKKGIVSELLDQARFGEDYRALLREVQQELRPRDRLAFAARFARKIYEAEVPVENLLRGAGMLAPELAEVENQRECQRYDNQVMLIDSLLQAKLLRPELTRQSARDILWCMTSRELFRMLVHGRGWPPDQYERWLRDALDRMLVAE